MSTRVSYIHGVPGNELPQRGLLVSQSGAYIPYTSMTQGEMRLAILRQQAEIFAQAYPDFPEYQKAVSMIDNALLQGVSNGVPFIGALSENLQAVASAIDAASRQTAPAAGQFFGRQSLANGVRIGAPIIPESISDSCEDYATKMANNFYGLNLKTQQWKLASATLPGPMKARKQRWLDYKLQCEITKGIEGILNDRLEKSSHHVLYKSISGQYAPINGTRLDTKRILHVSGIGALANVANVAAPLMDSWAEVGVMRNNAVVGAGPLSSIQSGLYVGADDSQAWEQYFQWSKNQKVDKIGEPVTAIVIAVLGAVTAALAQAAQMQYALNQKKQLALSAAQGFGTAAYSAEKGDLILPAQTQPGGTNNLLLVGGIVVAAYSLMND